MTRVAAVSHVLVVDDDRAFRHAVDVLLRKVGYATAQAGDGLDALAHLGDQRVDLVLLDIGLPGMNGLEVLAEARRLAAPPRIVIITSDDTPEALMASFRGQADRFVRKPITPQRIVDVVKEVLAVSAAATLPIEVVSATPEWVELVAPCSLDVADRIQEFVMNLNADVPEDTRESVGQAFRELLTNAIEWGGRLDASQQVRISCLRTEADAPLPHRRSRRRVRRGHAAACRRVQLAVRPARARAGARGAGPAARRARAADVAGARRRGDLQREAQRGRAREVSGLRWPCWTSPTTRQATSRSSR